MNNLIDSIQAFKAKKWMARQIPEAGDDLADMVYMYRTIWPGQDGLKEEFSRRWEKLSGNKKAELIDRLLLAGLLPEVVRYAVELFEGKVISLI